PETIVMFRRGRSRASERKAINASLATPSTGGAASRIKTAPPRMPSTRLRGDRGMTRTSSRLTGGLQLVEVRGPAFAGLRRSLIRLARPVEQNLLVGARLVLVADELERAIQRLD